MAGGFVRAKKRKRKKYIYTKRRIALWSEEERGGRMS